MYCINLRQSKIAANSRISKIACGVFVMALLAANKVWADDTVPLDPQFQVILDLLRSLWHLLKDMMMR